MVQRNLKIIIIFNIGEDDRFETQYTSRLALRNSYLKSSPAEFVLPSINKDYYNLEQGYGYMCIHISICLYKKKNIVESKHL